MSAEEAKERFLFNSAAPEYVASRELANGRPKWRELAVEILFRTGALRAAETWARTNELHFNGWQKKPIWRRSPGPRILILCYHRIGTGGVPYYSGLPASIFEAQMRYLRRHYRVLSLDDACRELECAKKTDPAVVVTFDDGYRDLYTQAFPALQKYAIPATIYLTAGSIETGEVAWYDRIFLSLRYAPGQTLKLDLGGSRCFRFASPAMRFHAAVEIIGALRTLPDGRRRECCAFLESCVHVPASELSHRMLTWQQVRDMHRAGISFGSHTISHPVVGQLDSTNLQRELVYSKQLIEERIGGRISHFAYPFGKSQDCGTAAGPVLVCAGYASAATTIVGVNTAWTNLLELRRVQCGEERSLAMFAFQINRHFLDCASELPPKHQGVAPDGPLGTRDLQGATR